MKCSRIFDYKIKATNFSKISHIKQSLRHMPKTYFEIGKGDD